MFVGFEPLAACNIWIGCQMTAQHLWLLAIRAYINQFCILPFI